MESEGVRRWLLRQAGCRGPVLEVGSGDGALSVDLARRGLAVTAVDLDAAQLRLGREAAAAAGVSDRLTWRQADGQRLDGLPPDAYGAAVLAFVLHHMEDPDAGLRAAWRVLASGGRLVVAEMLPRGPDAGDGCHQTSLDRWLALLAALEPAGLRLTVRPRQEWLLAVLEKGGGNRPPPPTSGSGRPGARGPALCAALGLSLPERIAPPGRRSDLGRPCRRHRHSKPWPPTTTTGAARPSAS